MGSGRFERFFVFGSARRAPRSASAGLDGLGAVLGAVAVVAAGAVVAGVASGVAQTLATFCGRGPGANEVEPP